MIRRFACLALLALPPATAGAQTRPPAPPPGPGLEAQCQRQVDQRHPPGTAVRPATSV